VIWFDVAKPGSAASASQIPHAHPMHRRVPGAPKTRDTTFRFDSMHLTVSTYHRRHRWTSAALQIWLLALIFSPAAVLKAGN
jgi:hypothetical protein